MTTFYLETSDAFLSGAHGDEAELRKAWCRRGSDRFTRQFRRKQDAVNHGLAMLENSKGGQVSLMATDVGRWGRLGDDFGTHVGFVVRQEGCEPVYEGDSATID